ncbi:MAG: adenosylmethionine--8-amino-7-oxononanoate transaminase [Actinobacteria bacterium]|nr:adenosylmethionine--8-amino-7-oxononanoate transaminase [Actinomycetota bacterium]
MIPTDGKQPGTTGGSESDRRSRTADLIDRDASVLWHPFTQQSVWLADEPIVVDHAEGMYFTDTDGNRYLDGVSSLWVNVHGHRRPEINAAIVEQLGRLDHTTFLGLTHEPGIVLAERLLASAPAGLDRVFYAGDGASAVEAALKIAYQAHAQNGQIRPFYAHVAEGYHGDTLGAVSVGGIDLFHQTYRSVMLRTHQVSSPGVLADPRQSRTQRAGEVLTELRALFLEHHETISALVIEPMVQAAGGMLTHDESFVRGARALCDEFGIYLIADEVATGIGRTGRMWACEHAGITPDLLTCGKGITAGYLPLSAVLATEDLYRAFLGTPASARTFFHGHSYTANPLAAAAAIANLDLMAAEGSVARAHEVGELMGRLLEPLADYDGVREVRRIGTMTGIEVESVGDRTGFAVCQAARSRGVWVRPLGDVVVLMPPLAIADDEVELLTGTVSDAIRTVVQ